MLSPGFAAPHCTRRPRTPPSRGLVKWTQSEPMSKWPASIHLRDGGHGPWLASDSEGGVAMYPGRDSASLPSGSCPFPEGVDPRVSCPPSLFPGLEKTESACEHGRGDRLAQRNINAKLGDRCPEPPPERAWPKPPEDHRLSVPGV